ncbi:uncharacterized protein F5Z01DRAFT_132137 [Emericellopsis atlantica]|uniref:DUF7702 domain-containing protein n=1 Tax=Emericellopsis atlantica TaxID=2614577 RepID=A0A9P7ZKL4_9HYPO|nr:uncharacterized protein F5Z01DRAFT_132137 [Emericellopsis atlantica]KAG9253849.1 hypothetical protein F5Z01DRAFT_132137 [Emericellopsis atlantica]
MSRSLDTYDHISIAEIVIYAFFLVVGVYLCFKHGVRRTTGWVYLVIFAIARILGSALRLATTSNPSDVGLYVGWQVLNGVALGPLILLLLGMLGRCYDSINRQGHVVVKPLYQRIIRLMMLVAIILTIVGGTQSDMTMQGGHVHVAYTTLSKAGTALMIPVFVMVILVAIIALFNQGYISQGEHRILFAVFASVPFVAVRLAYSCVLVLGGHQGSAWLFLGASVIMEMMAVLICEAVGVTLAKVPPAPKEDHQLREGHTRA